MPDTTGRTARLTAAAAAACLISMGGLAACGSDKADETSTRDTTTTTTTAADGAGGEETVVLDGTYTSTTVTGRTLVPDTEITMEFSGVQLAVNAGCNTITGDYVVTDDVLAFDGDPAMTMMGCDDALAAQDQWISTALTTGMTIETNTATSLVLAHGDLTIELVPGATPEGHDLSGQP